MTASGFTLIEMVVILVILAILGTVALPRLVDTSLFDQLGFTDNLRAALNYARQSAIAQRRWVKVTDQPNDFVLEYCDYTGVDGCDAPASCSHPLIDPGTGQAYGLGQSLPSGVSIHHANCADVAGRIFYFDCEGRPVDGSGAEIASAPYLICLTGANAKSLTVEAGSGYAH